MRGAVQTCTIGREGLYACGYLGLFPVLQGIMEKQVGWVMPSLSLSMSFAAFFLRL